MDNAFIDANLKKKRAANLAYQLQVAMMPASSDT